jgi:tRNA pseudouridine55 synthase
MSAAQPNRARSPKRTVDGILLLDKPRGITSNRALQVVKRIFRARKAGHTGSLDPLASGMLPLCLGQATKVSGWLLDADKEYEVRICFGSRTDTADADGEVIETSHKTEVTANELEAALVAHRGWIEQIPPMYSALKKDGRRLYELAREGIEVERPPRPIRIDEFEVIAYDPQRPVLRVRCSKGTYIRSLAETVAEHAGTVAHVEALRRIKVDPFDAARMIKLEDLEKLQDDEAALDSLLLEPDAALSSFPALHLGASEAFYLCNGHAVGHAPVGIEGVVRLYDPQGLFLGLGEVRPDGQIAPKRLFTGLEKGRGKSS